MTSPSVTSTSPPDEPGTRVAMFVLNPCHSDARVRKEAQALGAAGFDVRIYALGNSLWPAGVVQEDGFSIQRIEVVSRYQRIMRGLGGLYQRPAGSPRRPTAQSGGRRLAPLLAALGAPLLLLAGLWKLVRAGAPSLVPARRERPALDDALDAPQSSERGSVLRRLAKRGGHLAKRWVLSLRSGLHALGGRLRAWLLAVRWRLRMLAYLLRRLRRRLARRFYLAVTRTARSRLRVLHRPSVYLQFWKHAGVEAAAWRPEIVHAHDLNALPAAFRAAERLERRPRIVYDSHELWRHRNRVTRFHPVAKVLDAAQERRLIRRCDLVITVSPSIRDWLNDRYRLTAGRGVVVRNVPWHAEPAGSGTVRELAGLTDEQILLYTGRVTSGRGLEEAVDALAGLPPTLVLVMLGYGDGEYLDQLWERAERRSVRERVHLVPPVPSDQVAAVAASADLALVAIQPLCLSYRFALPNKLFEAIQGHVPVVATGLPEIAAVVRRYGLGELFDAGNAEAFAAAVRAVLADPGRYRAGARAAAADLVWEKESVLLVDAYERMIGFQAGADGRRPHGASSTDQVEVRRAST